MLSDILPRYLLSDFEMLPVDPIITGITCFYISLALYFNLKSVFFRIFSATVLITFLSPGISASIDIHFHTDSFADRAS
jgi:hypothetical protein